MSLIQEMMTRVANGGAFNQADFRRFSPGEIRECIQELVATEQNDLANALGDAALSLYPQSPDILAITSLLAMVNQDWHLAVELIDELLTIQGDATPAFTFVMMVRALRCSLDPHRALEMANKGLSIYPGQIELMAEKLSLDSFSNSLLPEAGQHH
jgi:hypothetical protein